jgi:hypothetical protein
VSASKSGAVLPSRRLGASVRSWMSVLIRSFRRSQLSTGQCRDAR